MKRVVVAAAVVALAVPGGAAAAPVVRTAVSPGAVLFGDPVVATATVAVDSSVYDPSTIAIAAPTGPWVVQSRDSTLGARRASRLEEPRASARLPHHRMRPGRRRYEADAAAAHCDRPSPRGRNRANSRGLAADRRREPPRRRAPRTRRGRPSPSRPNRRRRTGGSPPGSRSGLLVLLAFVLAAAAVALAVSQLRRRRPAARDCRAAACSRAGARPGSADETRSRPPPRARTARPPDVLAGVEGRRVVGGRPDAELSSKRSRAGWRSAHDVASPDQRCATAAAVLAAHARRPRGARRRRRRLRARRGGGRPPPEDDIPPVPPRRLERDRRARPLGEHLDRHVPADRRRALAAREERRPLRPRRLLVHRVRGSAAGHARPRAPVVRSLLPGAGR